MTTFASSTARDFFAHAGYSELDEPSNDFDASFTDGCSSRLAEALSHYVNTEQCGTALGLGADALTQAVGTDLIVSESGQVLPLMLSALRGSGKDFPAETILVAIGSWALVADIDQRERLSLMSLLDAGLTLIDQDQNQVDPF